MITEPKMYGVKCDNCGEHFETYEGMIAMNDESYMVDSANCSGWYTQYNDSEEDEHYCPNCWTLNDEDELVVLPNNKK